MRAGRGVLAALRVAVILVAFFSAGEWLRVVAIRIRDPYPVEWMEGAVVAHTLRWVAGQEIYVPPSASFIPALYPPLGYWVQGAAMKLLGPGLPAARAASAAATLGVVVLLGLIVHRRTRSLVAAVAVAGAFLDAYVACGSWYDLARNDMIFLFFGLASVFVVTGPARLWRTVVSALLAALAVWTRQQGLAIVAVGFLHLASGKRRPALVFLAVAVAATAPGIALLDRATGGWFLRTTWTTLGDYPMRYHRAPLVLERVLGTLWIPLLGAVIWLAGQTRRHHLAPLTSVWTLLMGAFFFNAVLAMIKEGGDVNHLIPVVLFALVLGGFALGELDRQQRKQPSPPRSWLLAFMLVLFVVQYLVWPHPSRALAPDPVRATQRQVVAEIAAIPGDVLALDDPYYLWLAGKPLNADGGAIFWLSFEGLDLPPDLVDRVSGERYAAIVLTEPVELGVHARTASGRRFYELVRDHYAFTREIRPGDPWTDRLRVPRYLYVPKGRTAAAPREASRRDVRP